MSASDAAQQAHKGGKGKRLKDTTQAHKRIGGSQKKEKKNDTLVEEKKRKKSVACNRWTP